MKFEVEVSQIVTVELDESKFTPEFMKEFQDNFYDFMSLRDHACHLAQLYARGIAYDNKFIEGYGEPKSMGISFVGDDTFQNVLSEIPDGLS